MIPSQLTLHAVAPIGAAPGSTTMLYEVLGLPRGQYALIQREDDEWRILQPEGPQGPWRAWSDAATSAEGALTALEATQALRR